MNPPPAPRPSELPAVSILLPVRDAAETLTSCLTSLRDQTWSDWECLAVNDHSIDRSFEILEEWAARDRRFRVLSAPDPGGIVAALEEGRRHARGWLLARQDADDRSEPERLERQVADMKGESGPAVLGCLTHADGEPTPGMRRYLAWLETCVDPATVVREIWVECPIAHPTAMMRASVVESVGGYREMGWPEDYDLWLRIHRAGGAIVSLPERLYEWTDHPERLSRRDPRYAAEAFLRCRLYHLRRWLHEREVDRPLIVWGAGRDGRHLARAWELMSHEPGPPQRAIDAFVDIDPRKIGRTRRGRPILDLISARRSLPDAFYLVAVGVEGARDLIRASLTGEGLSEGRDFVCLH